MPEPEPPKRWRWAAMTMQVLAKVTLLITAVSTLVRAWKGI